jgi:hypothetical protein
MLGMDKSGNLQLDLSFAVLLVLVSITCACGGGGSTGNPISLSSGLYLIDSGTSSASSPPIFVVAGSLTVNGNNISGTMHVTYPACFSPAIDIPVIGTLTDTINLRLSMPGGQALSFTLTHPGGHPTFVGGNYTITAGGCIGPNQGLAGGSLLYLTGTWHGTLVSSTSVNTQITMLLNQAGPDSHGFFTANGNATLTGGTCFSAGTIDASNTQIIGQGSKLTLVSSSPGGSTVLSGDFGAGGFFGATFSGTYTSNQGACSESGTVSMSTP